MFTTEKARSGKLTLLFNGKSIHSRYDPAAEADTFLKQQIFNKTPYLFIIIGPGLGYLKASILKLYPHAKILSLHMDNQIYELNQKTGDNWFYGSEKKLSSKLSEFIPDFQLLETAIIKWLPCTNFFPERTKNIESVIHQFFLERKGSIFTIGSFGRTWLNNISLNIFTKRKLLMVESIDSLIIIAASGPSLADAIIPLKKNRDKYILAALTSSLPALNNAGILPDFIFHTDPGYWAKEHLKHISNNNIPIIMPLTSSFYSNIKNPLILINQGSLIENILLKNYFPKVLPHGTVAGSAYLFFRQISKSPIVFAGLDLCYRDVKEHVAPHSFDIIFDQKQNRLNGYLNLMYNRQQTYGSSYKDIKTNKAFSTYSGWFNNKSRLSNCYRLNSSLVTTKGLININFDQLITLLNTGNNINFIINSKKLNNDTFIKSDFTNFLKNIIIDLKEFNRKIETMNQHNILSFFTEINLLTEIFQYTAYSDILKLSHFYRTDPGKSKEILQNIYSKSFSYVSSILDRYNCE